LRYEDACTPPPGKTARAEGPGTKPQLSRAARKADNPAMPTRCRIWLTIAVLVAFPSALLWAAKEFVMPKTDNANTYPLKDAHSNEKVTVAVDVYNAAPKDDIFITRYSQEGILPIFLVVTNDGDQPITLKGMRAQLVTARRTKLEGLDVEDVFRRVAHIQGSNPRQVGPITLPGGNKNKKAQQQYDEITRAHFAAEAVEPHTTRSGFLFFDVLNVQQPVAGAHLYLTGVLDSRGSELMYFEVPLIPANAAAGGQ
jgi:hypothetical protein